MSESKNSLREENDLLLEQLEQMQDEIERKDILIADLQRQRKKSENSSVMSMLKNKVGEQSEEIVRLNEMVESLNEWIGRVSESDLIVKENEQLKQRNKKLESEKQDIKREAENEIQGYKKKAEDADRTAQKMEQKAQSIVQYYNQLIQYEEKKVEEGVERIVFGKIKNLEQEYNAAVGLHRAFWIMLLLFSVVLAVLLALKNEAFVSDLLSFSTGLGKVVRMCR